MVRFLVTSDGPERNRAVRVRFACAHTPRAPRHFTDATPSGPCKTPFRFPTSVEEAAEEAAEAAAQQEERIYLSIYLSGGAAAGLHLSRCSRPRSWCPIEVPPQLKVHHRKAPAPVVCFNPQVCRVRAGAGEDAKMGESDYEEADDDFDDEGAAVRIPWSAPHSPHSPTKPRCRCRRSLRRRRIARQPRSRRPHPLSRSTVGRSRTRFPLSATGPESRRCPHPPCTTRAHRSTRARRTSCADSKAPRRPRSTSPKTARRSLRCPALAAWASAP